MTRRSRRTRLGWLMTAAIVLSPSLVIAQDSLSAARDLYAAAAYEEALAALNRLGSGTRAQDGRAIEQYRAFCLLALGRADEAERAIEAVVIADPAYHPTDNDASPRIRAAFSEVRRRMLPTVTQEKYAQAKAAFDRKDYALATEMFGQVLVLFADPDMSAAVSRPPLSDLKTLTLGFRDLSLQAAAPPPAAVEAPAPATAAATAGAASIPAAPAPRIFSASDSNVIPPNTIRQGFPPYNNRLVRPSVGMIEVLIDETGSVMTATMRGSINPGYDKMLLGAAAGWKYMPATLDGVPVRYRKFIQVALQQSP